MLDCSYLAQWIVSQLLFIFSLDRKGSSAERSLKPGYFLSRRLSSPLFFLLFLKRVKLNLLTPSHATEPD